MKRSDCARGRTTRSKCMTESQMHSRPTISLRGRLRVVISLPPRSALASARVVLICVVAGACHKSAISQLSNGTRYRSVAEARAQMPASCATAPLYVIDGVPQEDSIAAYTLPSNDLEGVYLVQPSAPSTVQRSCCIGSTGSDPGLWAQRNSLSIEPGAAHVLRS